MSSIQNETIAMIVKDDDFISDDEIVNTLVENKINVNIENNTDGDFIDDEIISTLESKMDNHKINYNLCNENFMSQYAFINETQYEIVKYLETKDILGNHIIKCLNGHELVFANGEKIKPYFRHKNKSDMDSNNMSVWHAEWQSNFPIIEQCFVSEYQIKNRRADVVLEESKIILEIQHSEITQKEVNNRNHDYRVNNMEVSWIIDGNTINIKDLNTGVFLLTFPSSGKWKYESFKNCNYIYVDINEQIFRINPKKVKSDMIYVNQFVLKNEFINSLKTNIQIWNDEELDQEILYFNQRGAGCGKTYESIQLLNSDDRFLHKEIFIYLTKMNTAVEVIYNEIVEQERDNKLNNLEFIKKYSNIGEKKNKKYIIKYKNKKTNSDNKIIIGTIDSFMFALNEETEGNDYFSGIIKKIKEGCIESNDKLKKALVDGKICYGKENVKLNKKCLIVVDESQDLTPIYIEAVEKIMKSTNIDAYIIGDKLQSIFNEYNIYTYLDDNKLSLQIKQSAGKNQVMRFHNTHFIDFVNRVIDFKKYNLPPITGICDIKCKYSHENDVKPYKIFQMIDIFKDAENEFTNEEDENYQSDNDHISKLIHKIIKYIESEIAQYGYVPNNFMFIFPILKCNHLANRLEGVLQQFWINKFNDKKYQNDVLITHKYWKDRLNNNEYYKYVYLHKSEENKPINLKESENSSRILSIHASKGSGCEVVFLLNLNERALKKFSSQQLNIKYDSLLHVAITRQKKSLYIGLVDVGDDIWERFKEQEIEMDNSIEPNILKDMSRYNKLDTIEDYFLDNTHIFNTIESSILIPNKYIPENYITDNNNTDDIIIDWGHHQIRYYVFQYNIWSNIVKEKFVDMKQYWVVLDLVSNQKIQKCEINNYYDELNNIYDNNRKFQSIRNKFPILFLNSNSETRYCIFASILEQFITKIQNKLKSNIPNNKLPLLCPFEITILMHMIQIFKKGKYSEFSIMDLYYIMSCYYDCYKYAIGDKDHSEYKCMCDKTFIKKDNLKIEVDKYIDIRNSIMNHYEKTSQITDLYKNYKDKITETYDKYIKLEYNILHTIFFSTNEKQGFEILENYDTIGYSKKYAVYFIITPQFNKINFNKIMIKSLINSYLLTNIKKNDDNVLNYNKFNNKKIITCIFTLDSINPVFIAFDINAYGNIIKQYIKEYLLNKYSSCNLKVYNIFKYYERNNPNPNVKGGLSFFIDKLKTKEYKKLPQYIKKHFEQIKSIKHDRLKNKNKTDDIDDILNDETLFLNDIKSKLEIDIDKFFDTEEQSVIDESDLI